MRQCVAFVDRHNMRGAVPSRDDQAGSHAGAIQGKHWRWRQVHAPHTERLMHDLHNPLHIGSRVERCHGDENVTVCGVNAKLIEEDLMPNLLDAFPVHDDLVFNRVPHGEYASLALGFVPYIDIFRRHAAHHPGMLATPHHCRQDTTGGIIARKARLDKAAAAIDDHHRCLVILLVLLLASILAGSRIPLHAKKLPQARRADLQFFLRIAERFLQEWLLPG
mmetsp:Transcript_22008/g.49294  ORF Transcript_22008/g.49294 Transcript_22008/m.49294 type:complete len:221 (-) Transcript_22008:23-685(-)